MSDKVLIDGEEVWAAWCSPRDGTWEDAIARFAGQSILVFAEDPAKVEAFMTACAASSNPPQVLDRYVRADKRLWMPYVRWFLRPRQKPKPLRSERLGRRIH